jgi:hypothetical protein
MSQNAGGLLIFILVLLLSTALILLWSLGLGWILTLILPLELFEGALLVMIASITSVAILMYSVRSFEEDPKLELLDTLPIERFTGGSDRPTLEQLFRYQLANDMVMIFEDEPSTTNLMDQRQREELAIRLSEICSAAVRNKPTRIKNPKISKADLKKQMSKMNLKPYDDNLLDIAVKTTNVYIQRPLWQEVFASQIWEQQSPLID